MGREWLYWVGGGGGRRRRSIKEEGTTSAGCMCAVFQLFDMHTFHLPLNHQHSYHLHPTHHTFLKEEDEATSFKGLEAPRNSLEMEDPKPMKAAASIKQQNLNFPVGINQIKTRASKSRTEDYGSSDCSPGTKTPNLLARLMGLDLLPSPSSTPNPQTKSHLIIQKRCFSDDDISVGARSLPETPRVSSSSRRSDVDHHHRLSLQINKSEEFTKLKRGRFRSKQDENNSSSSPGNYAKQIVKQVRESVSRRVGLMDITNRDRDVEHRRDQNLLIKLHKKNSKHSNPEIAPEKLRFSSVAEMAVKSPRSSTTSSSDQGISRQQKIDSKKVDEIRNGVKKLKQQGMGKKKEETFVRSAVKKSKKPPPLSTELLPVKKDPSPPATKLPQKQVSSDALSSKRNSQLSCKTSHSYGQLPNIPDKISTVLPDTSNGCATTPPPPDYKSYVTRILKRAGIIDSFTPLTLGKWHTPAHPLDPSIFYYLELFHPAGAAFLSRRCNRKLIFQLVDELLAGVLRPHLDFKLPWVSPIVGSGDQFALDDELCRRIESFPAADCRFLEDIDSLIDKDLCGSPLNGYYEEEGEGVVCEIEGEIVEWLVCETVAVMGVRTKDGRRLDQLMSRG